MDFPNVLIIMVLSLVSSVETNPIILCYKPEFHEAAFHGHLKAASPGTVLTLTCKEAYKPGSPTTTCKDGQWTKPTPPCQLVKCQNKDLIRSKVLISFTCQGVGCMANLTCVEGYWYEGPMTKVCQRDGTWSGPNVTCEAIQCVELPNLPNGNIHQNNRSYLAIITVRCDERFSYTKPDSSSRQCQANNTWSGEEGWCEPIKCHKLPDFDNGKVLQENRSYSAEAVMTCNTGYTYSEPTFTSRHCLANATWSGKQGFCQVDTCPQLTAIDNGGLSGTSGNFSDHVTLQCKPGYTLDGASSIHCLAGGTWSANLGICQVQQNLMGVWILLAFLIIGVSVAVAIILYRFKRKPMTVPEGLSQNTETRKPLFSKDPEVYLRLTVTKSFGGEYGDESSSQYAAFKLSIEENVLDAMKNIPVKAIEALLIHKPDKISLCIISQEPIDQEAVRTALEQVTIPCTLQKKVAYQVDSESIIFDDNTTSDIKLQILRGKHICDHKMDFEIDLDSQYEELRVIRRSEISSGQTFSKDSLGRKKDGGEDISDVDIVEGGVKNQKILILGRAGVGKSTLMQRLARKWANGAWATHLKAIFFLNLRYLTSDKKKMTFASVVSLIPTYVNVDNIIKIDDKWLEENQEAIAIMLDGLDENGKVRKLWDKFGDSSGDATSLDWCFRLLKRKYLPKSTLLVSSRSSEDVHSLLNPTDTVEVMGLLSTKIPSFIRRNVEKEHRQKVTQSLKDNEVLVSISSITFYCAALCRLLQKDDTAANLNTYTKLTACLLEMYICRSLKDDHTWKDVYDKMGTRLKSMSQLAYVGLTASQHVQNFKVCYSEDNLKDAGLNKKNVTKLRNAGLLLRTETPKIENPRENVIWAQFVHSSIQQYMAMAYLLTQGREERRQTLDKLVSASSQFNMALIYLVGLAFNDGDDSALARTSAAVGNPSRRDLGRTQDIKEALTDAAVSVLNPLLAVQMVHESQSIDVASRVGEKRFRDGIKLENTKMTLIEVKGLTFLLRNCPSIAKIELRDVGLDQSSIQEVSNFLRENESIKEASLLDSTIDGSSIRELMEGVKENNHLKKLELSFGRNIGDDSVVHVADALVVNTELKDLRLAGGNLGNRGALALLRALQTGNPQVRIRMYGHSYDEPSGKDLEPYIQAERLIFEEEFPQNEAPT